MKTDILRRKILTNLCLFSSTEALESEEAKYYDTFMNEVINILQQENIKKKSFLIAKEWADKMYEEWWEKECQNEKTWLPDVRLVYKGYEHIAFLTVEEKELYTTEIEAKTFCETLIYPFVCIAIEQDMLYGKNDIEIKIELKQKNPEPKEEQ